MIQQLPSPSLTPTSQHQGCATGNAEADSPGVGGRHTEVPLGTPADRVVEGHPGGTEAQPAFGPMFGGYTILPGRRADELCAVYGAATPGIRPFPIDRSENW